MTNVADDFEAIAKRMKELAETENSLPAGSIPDEVAIEPKTGKRYRWTGKEWLEEEYTVPIFSFWGDYGIGAHELSIRRTIARRLANLRALSCAGLLQRDV